MSFLRIVGFGMIAIGGVAIISKRSNKRIGNETTIGKIATGQWGLPSKNTAFAIDKITGIGLCALGIYFVVIG